MNARDGLAIQVSSSCGVKLMQRIIRPGLTTPGPPRKRAPSQRRCSCSRNEQVQADGRRTVIPRIITDDVAGLVRFLKTVFGAGGEPQSAAPTEMTMGDSVVMISDGGGAREAMPAFLYVYAQNADETYERAIAAGAESIEKPMDMPYGDRRATV
jgi:PhnB protein